MKHLSRYLVITFLILSGCSEIKPKPLVQKVFIYEKSNLDGSNKGQIAVYYEKEGKIEAFKWHEGHQQATVVRAWVNQDDYTVRRFEALRTNHLGNEKLNAVLEVTQDRTVNIQLGDQNQVFKSAPAQWHSYDFDFSSLGYAYRYIRNKNQPISFNILDIELNQTPYNLKDFGSVEMTFLGEEEKLSRQVLKYGIDGPGLDNRGGYIWFGKSDSVLVAFEIEKPDEPGYESGKLELKETLQMNQKEWAEFKMNKLSNSH
ncbi:hypothetical protein [Eudoraea adriatica]|uniref:hypothetical protein n=1 Tax=Eudoraea adriatica TaxID=446681 RepID=UPI000360BCE4|nr:hypothetical protein [Eudoraea adriatica]